MIKKILKKINSVLFTFKPSFYYEKKLEHIGTIYGGYDICIDNLSNPTIISCGLGEDATFDIDMINKFNAKVIAIDPTPRALKHYNDIKKNFGKKNSSLPTESGKLKISNYNLEKVNEKNYFFIYKALWKNNDKKLKLFFPKNKENVSLSINKNSKFGDEYFLANTIIYNDILSSFNIQTVDILKLDIEGAEIEVLESIIKSPNLPKQILVEFDIRRRPSLNSYLTLRKIHSSILNNYYLAGINKKGDFTYIKNR